MTFPIGIEKHGNGKVLASVDQSGSKFELHWSFDCKDCGFTTIGVEAVGTELVATCRKCHPLPWMQRILSVLGLHKIYVYRRFRVEVR